MNRFLGTDRIYQKAIGSHRAGVFLLVLAILVLVGLTVAGVYSFFSSPDSRGSVLAVYLPGTLIGLAATIRGLVKKIVVYRIVRGRHYLGKIDPDNQHPNGSRVGVSILREEARADRKGKWSAASFKARVLEKGESWWLYDATSVVHNDKGMPVAERCYTVFEAKLRQVTPHLVFDGKGAKGRQFKSIYSNSQQLKRVLGAEFDRLFAAYSPAHHTIETLSFITPEVIEAMQTMGDCDLEFVDNSLLCYTSFLSADRLGAFRRRCFNLHAKVNDNLRLYKPKEAEIKPFGRRLLKSYRHHLVVGVLLIGLAGFLAVLAVDSTGPDGKNVVWMAFYPTIIGLSGVVALVSGLKGRSGNRRDEQNFLRSR